MNDPKVDYAFKRVYGDQRNADILIHFLNAILKWASPIISIEILNPFSDKDYSDDKLTILDIKARDQQGRIFNVEMQILLPPHFHGRILYYQAGAFREQIGEGDSYEMLRPVISICLVNRTMFEDVGDYHLKFRLRDEQHGICFSDHLEIHVLQLPRFDESLEGLSDPLEKWLYFFRHAESMDANQVPEVFDEPAYHRAAKELDMLTKDQLERERYESRLKAIRDQMDFEQGAKQAREQGLEQGQDIGRIHLCQRQLGRTLTPVDELAQLAAEELRQRAEELEAELFAS